jgi:hypothetical protein
MPLAQVFRTQVHTAILAVAAMKAGGIATGGATAAVLDQSLMAMRDIIDRSIDRSIARLATLFLRRKVAIATSHRFILRSVALIISFRYRVYGSNRSRRATDPGAAVCCPWADIAARPIVATAKADLIGFIGCSILLAIEEVCETNRYIPLHYTEKGARHVQGIGG